MNFEGGGISCKEVDLRYSIFADLRYSVMTSFFRLKKTTVVKTPPPTSMKSIRLNVEQVSKESFLQGWMKAEPRYINEIVNM